jgi:hypothetical protein
LESRSGGGRHFHLAFLLGQKVEDAASTTSALALFVELCDAIRPALTGEVETLRKGPRTDISTLLNPQGVPWLVGITNYGREEDGVEIRLPRRSGILRCSGRDDVPVAAGSPLRLAVPARSATAWFFEPAA